MNASIFIGVVIPLFNAERFIGRTLESLLSQTYSCWKCVIVDDGSTDGSAQIVRQYCDRDSRFSFYQQQNAGVSKARDAGFALLPAVTTHVTFMDNDDVYVPDAFETLVDAIVRDTGVIGAHGTAELINEHGQLLKSSAGETYRPRVGYLNGTISEFPPDLPTSLECLILGNPVCPPGLLLAQREAYRKAGAWDALLTKAQDWDMMIRLARHGNFHYVPKVIVHYRRHATNGSNDVEATAREMRKVYHKTFFSPENTCEQQKLMRQAWRAWQLHRARHKLYEAAANFRNLSVGRAARNLAEVFVHGAQWIRGRPTQLGC